MIVYVNKSNGARYELVSVSGSVAKLKLIDGTLTITMDTLKLGDRFTREA